MQVAAFIFIQRKWEDDKSHFEKMLDYFCDINEPLQLLIFPEGTDLTGMLHLLSSCGVVSHGDTLLILVTVQRSHYFNIAGAIVGFYRQ